jgi:DNA repair protein RadC
MYTFKLKTFHVSEAPTGEDAATSPRLAHSFLAPIFAERDADVEHFVMLALNAKGKAIGFKVIGQGTVTACLASPREVYRAALALGASSIVVAHNHPSGDVEPSREDIALTERLERAGEALGVPLADHLIVSADYRFLSLRARGVINAR